MSTENVLTLPSDSSTNLERLNAEDQPKSLSKPLAEHLFNMAKEVTSKEVNPDTVKASVSACETLLKLMKFNFELKKHK